MLIFKDRSPHNIFALERISNFTICSLYCQGKSASGFRKNRSERGVEQAFMPADKAFKVPVSLRRRPSRSAQRGAT
jgi:hypothetical protein